MQCAAVEVGCGAVARLCLLCSTYNFPSPTDLPWRQPASTHPIHVNSTRLQTLTLLGLPIRRRPLLARQIALSRILRDRQRPVFFGPLLHPRNNIHLLHLHCRTLPCMPSCPADSHTSLHPPTGEQGQASAQLHPERGWIRAPPRYRKRWTWDGAEEERDAQCRAPR